MERTKEFQGDSQSFQTASGLYSPFSAGEFTSDLWAAPSDGRGVKRGPNHPPASFYIVYV